MQIRQDFSKKLINVLQTGSANLTLADSNEEAANSQALSTRQSIATSGAVARQPVAAERSAAAAHGALAVYGAEDAGNIFATAKRRITETAGPKPRRLRFAGSVRRDQRSSCRTPCCDWLASAQRGGRDRLAGRQRLAVGRFLVEVGERQVGRTGLQHVDDVLVEVLADLHDRQVGAEGRSLRPQRDAGGVELADRTVLVVDVVDEVGARGERSQAETGPD